VLLLPEPMQGEPTVQVAQGAELVQAVPPPKPAVAVPDFTCANGFAKQGVAGAQVQGTATEQAAPAELKKAPSVTVPVVTNV
jgi:hypothetical protein